MVSRNPSLAAGVLVAFAVVLAASRCWAHWYELGPSPDEWGVKYEGEVNAAGGDKLNVRFTIADPGRLKPIHSVFVMALGNPDSSGGRAYLLKTPVSMKPAKDGKLTGEVEVDKEFANRAMIRIFTLTVDGKSQMAGPMAGARYYDIPLLKFMLQAPPANSSQSRSPLVPPPAATLAK